jgi:hypothetical protein
MLNFLRITILILVLGPISGPSSVFANEELQKSLEQAREKSEELLKQFKNFQQANANQQQKPTQNTNAMAALNDPKTRRAMTKMLKRYQNMSVEDIEKEILTGSQGTKTHYFFKKYPKSLEFMARTYQDPQAIPRAIEMMDDRDKLKQVGIYMLGTIIISFLLGKIMIRPNMGLMKRLTMRLTRAVMIWGLRGGILVYFYGYYLSPMWRIAKTVFLRNFNV